jgi:hypothetical protein
MKTSIVCVALFMLFMALHPAHAQRCPAGADAFMNCLPLDHRTGGPGEISIQQRRFAQSHRNTGNRYLNCIHNRTTALIRRGDPRALRSVEATRSGYRYGIGPPEYARAYQSMLRENERACGKSR